MKIFEGWMIYGNFWYISFVFSSVIMMRYKLFTFLVLVNKFIYEKNSICFNWERSGKFSILLSSNIQFVSRRNFNYSWKGFFYYSSLFPSLNFLFILLNVYLLYFERSKVLFLNLYSRMFGNINLYW